MSIANTLPKHLKPRREKVFGLARWFAHDRNARVRIETYVISTARPDRVAAKRVSDTIDRMRARTERLLEPCTKPWW